MRPQEAALLREAIDIEEDETDGQQAMMQAARSHWPVSIIRKSEDMDVDPAEVGSEAGLLDWNQVEERLHYKTCLR